MTRIRRLQVIRIGIVIGCALGSSAVAGLLLAAAFPQASVGPLMGLLLLPLWLLVIIPSRIFDWMIAASLTHEAAHGVRVGMTTTDIDGHFRARDTVTIDDDPEWGKLVEGRNAGNWTPIAAVQVTNATAEPDGTFKKYWLRVPARGDRQPARTCSVCQRDIAFPPRRAKEAIAWTFGLCEDHYTPNAAS